MSQAMEAITEGEHSLSESDCYELLASETRRTALDVFVERSTPVALDDLAVEVATRAADGTTPDEGSVERTAVRLHHVDLPKMDAISIIDYDQEEPRINSNLFDS